MHISLDPECQRFVEEQVKAGHFHSTDDVCNEAISRMKIDAERQLDDATVASINRAEEQIDRGDGIDFDKFAAELRVP